MTPRIGRLIACELWHRLPSSMLSVMAVAVAAALCVMLISLDAAAQRETGRIMRDLGFNLRIIPAAVDMEQFYLQGYATETMPEEAVHRLAAQKTVAYNHLVASLQQKMTVGDHQIILMGISGSFFPPGQQKPAMIAEIPAGQAHVGCEVAALLGLQAGDVLPLGDKALKVVRVLPPARSLDDLRVMVCLADAQAILGAPGQINEIRAIDCLCQTADRDPESQIQAAVQEAVPEAKAVLLRSLADTRARQRQLMADIAKFAIPLVLLATMLIVGILSYLNTRERQAEIGLLHALGYGGDAIGSLVLGKAALLGLVGGALGAIAGGRLAMVPGTTLFHLTGAAVHWDWLLIGAVTASAPVLAAASAGSALAIALTHDPARILAACRT